MSDDIKPVAWAFFFYDGEISNEFFGSKETGEKWESSDDCLWDGVIGPLYDQATIESLRAKLSEKEGLSKMLYEALVACVEVQGVCVEVKEAIAAYEGRKK